jgi:hypothetical protein
MAEPDPATHGLEAPRLPQDRLAATVRRSMSPFLQGWIQYERTGLSLCATSKSWVAGPSPAMTMEEFYACFQHISACEAKPGFGNGGISAA